MAAGSESRVEANFVGLESGFDGVVIKRGAEIRVAHGLDGEALAAIEIGSESGAEGYAIIGSGGLNEKILDDAGSEDFAVGFGIEGDASGKTQIAAARFFESEADDAHHRGFAQILNREGDILVAVINVAFGDTRRAERGRPARKGAAAIAHQQIRVDLVGRRFGLKERAEIHAGFTVGSEAHDFPLVGVGSEAEEFGEAGIEEAEGIGPVDGLEMLDAAFAAAPDGGGFPGAAAVHDDDGGIVKAGVGIGADGVGEMMIHETELRLGRAKLTRKAPRAAALVPHAEKLARRVQNTEIAGGPAAGGEKFQVMAKRCARSLPSKTYFIDLAGRDFREIEAGLNGELREAGIMLEAADAFLGNSEK